MNLKWHYHHESSRAIRGVQQMEAIVSELGWILFVGVGATLAMDIWALLLRHVFGIASLDYAWVGRWIGHMVRGRFAHDRIAAAPPVAGERLLGWTAHYAIGVAFAAPLLLGAGTDWARQPTPWPAIATGVASLAAPFFVMQPAFGLGIAAARTPRPNVARFRSLLTHLIFGGGLYGTALIFASLFPHHFPATEAQSAFGAETWQEQAFGAPAVVASAVASRETSRP